MKILFYDTKPYDQDSFEKAAPQLSGDRAGLF